MCFSAVPKHTMREKPFFFRSAIVFFLFYLAYSFTADGQDLRWRAGVAKTVITPEKKVWLAGYGYKREPEGVLHDIWVKALVLEDAKGYRAVLVTSDLMGFPRHMYESVTRKLMQRFNLKRSQILITFSHNHCGPRLSEDLVDYYPKDSLQTVLVKEYSDILENKMIRTVAEAMDDMSPAGLSTGEGTTDFAVNRRNNPEQEVPYQLALGKPFAGPVDHRVPVLAVRRADGRLAAILFGYACHPTTMSFNQWCGDYPGFAQIALEKHHPGATALFFNSGGGDQNPLPRRKVELCELYGKMLSEAVENALQSPLKPVSPELRTAFEFTDLDYLASPDRKELEASLYEPGKDTTARARIRASWAQRMLERLDAGETFPSSYSYPVEVWKLGDHLLWICLGGEAVVDYALRFKKEYGPDTWLFGYSNVLVAYIPSRRVYEEGGYEGGSFLYEYGLPADRWGPDVETRIADTVHRLVLKVQ